MDPNAALEELRKLVQSIKDAVDGTGDAEDLSLQERVDTILEAGNGIVDHWDGLDRWLSRGGFLPADWADGR